MNENTIAGAIPTDERGLLIVEDTPACRMARCPFCGHLHRTYRVAFSRLHLRLTRQLFEYCVKNRTYKVRKRDLNLSGSDYGNFPFLQRFGLLYHLKPDESGKRTLEWGVPVKRLSDFLKGRWAVAKWTRRDVDARKTENSEERIFCHQVPKGEKILDPETLTPVFVEFDNLTDAFDQTNFPLPL